MNKGRLKKNNKSANKWTRCGSNMKSKDLREGSKKVNSNQ